MLKRIGPSIDPWGTPYKLDFASDMILSIFTEVSRTAKIIKSRSQIRKSSFRLRVPAFNNNKI